MCARRQLVALGELPDGARQQRFVVFAGRAGTHQEPGTRHRRERHGDLQFGVIVAASLHEGVRPAVVEHVLALAVRFDIAGHAACDFGAAVLRTRCRGVQPVRPPTAPASSSAFRKAWAMNGLKVAGSRLAHASHASAGMSAILATTSTFASHPLFSPNAAARY